MKTDYTAEDLKERIRLYKVNITKDTELNRIEETVLLRSVWAHVEAKTATDTQTQTGERPQVKYIFTVRYADDILETVTKIGYKSKVLNISAPLYQTENKFIIIEAVESYGQKYDEFSPLP